MINTSLIHKTAGEVPECCCACQHLESMMADYDGWLPLAHYCLLGLMLPTRKKTCKKQKKYRKEVA